MEGNWFSPKGAVGSVRIHASVESVPTQSESDPVRDHTLKLTPVTSTVERSAIIVAPGKGRHDYNVFYIDTRDFASGVLVIDIQISANSSTDGSFDLFPGDVPPPILGSPGHSSLLGRYDVRRGTVTRVEYRFKPGQLFAFGLEGNWFGARGANGTVLFRASVK